MRVYALVAIFLLFSPQVVLAQKLPKVPDRIVSLAPVATEFLFALGVGDKVVGVTKYCDRPSTAKRITKIGGFADPQLEVIIKLHPDLVVATPFGATQNIVSALQARGIATLAQPVESLADMRSFLQALGKVTNRVQEARKLQQSIDAKFATLKNASPPAPFDKGGQIPKVLLLISVSPIIAAGPATFAGEILQHLGARNAVTTTSTAWPVMSLEALMHSPPDMIVITEGSQRLDAAQKVLKRLKNKVRIIAPAKPFLQRPGPYMLDDAQTLLTLLQNANV